MGKGLVAVVSARRRAAAAPATTSFSKTITGLVLTGQSLHRSMTQG